MLSTIDRLVEDFTKNQTSRFTSKDVQVYLKLKLGVFVRKHRIVKILKNKLNLSFKSTSTRASQMDPLRTATILKLFLIELSPFINNYTLFVNVDETHFSRHTYYRRTWIPKGKRYALKNTNIINSTSLLSAITSEGEYFISPTSAKVDTQVFKEYF